MKTPHKHAEIIKAWADGADIEVRFLNASNKDWHQWENIKEKGLYFQWEEKYEYRIKPEPKPDVFCLYSAEDFSENFYGPRVTWTGSLLDSNLKLWFDGETGALKAAEVLK